MNFSNAPDATIWSTSAGGLSSTNGSNTKFTAPSNAVEKVTVTASFPSGKPLELDFQVLEPIGYDQAHTYISATNHYLPGVAVAGMSIHVVFAPTMVSFYRVQIEEVGLDASDVWGFFADTNLFTVNPEHLLHHRSDVFRDLNYDNSWVSDDQCQTSSVFPPPWVPGGYTWEIPGKWRVGADGDQIVILEPWSQIISLDSDGTMTIDKFGLWVERGTNDVIHVGP